MHSMLLKNLKLFIFLNCFDNIKNNFFKIKNIIKNSHHNIKNNFLKIKNSILIYFKIKIIIKTNHCQIKPLLKSKICL